MLHNQREPHNHPRLLIAALALVFAALCLAYNWALPLFEAPDEGAHYLYVEHIARTGEIPSMDDMPSHEVSQPPLYYLLAAPLIAWIDRSDFAAVYLPNPGLDNGIVYDHAPAEREFPPRGVVLAVRILRLYSTILGILTILLAYATAFAALQRTDVALVALALTAFNPKFLHMSSQFNNDIAVACAAALTLWLTVRMVKSASLPSLRLCMAAGAAAGLALASKYSGVVLIAPVAVGVAWLALRHFQHAARMSGVRWRETFSVFIRYGMTAAFGFLFACGWLLLYNTIQYGDPFAVAQVQNAHALGIRPEPLSLLDIIARLPKVLTSYWGEFGHGVQSPPMLDFIMVALAALVCIGLVVAALRRQIPAVMSLLLITALLSFGLITVWMRNQTGTENSRLLSAAFTSVAAFSALGLMALIPRAWQHAGAFAMCATSVAIGVSGLFVTLIPGYATPVYLTDAQTAELTAGDSAVFDNGIELVRVDLPANRITPGAELEIGVYWRATRPITDLWRAVVELRDEYDQSLGRISTLPLAGRYATTQLEVGRTFRDVYRVQVSVTQRSVARVLVGWYQHRPPHSVSLVLDSGAASAQVGLVKVRGAQPAPQTPPTLAASRFGELIALEGYEHRSNTLVLYWRCLAAPTQNYKVFVHALAADGAILAQADAFTDYPMTFWEAGEQIIDTRTLEVPPKTTALRVGLYDPATGERLTALGTDGTAWADNAVMLDIIPPP